MGPERQRLWFEASIDPSPTGVAALDAAVRFEAASLNRADASKDVRRLFECSRTSSCSGSSRVPEDFWFARDGGKDKNGNAQVTLRGAVLLVFNGRAPTLQ
jgi:hypothetical protein